MNSLIPLVGTIAMFGSALIGGVFFAFSSFVMKALARMPSTEGITAMQSINVVVINRSFLGAFMGTALLSLGMVALALVSRSHASSMWFLGGAIAYLAGTFFVTLFGNVPLNDQLAAVSATDTRATQLWEHYVDKWTMWNHVRTFAAMLAAVLYGLGLAELDGFRDSSTSALESISMSGNLELCCFGSELLHRLGS